MAEKSKHREAFRELADKAREELGESLKKLVLYGSVARGEENADSDLDMFAVVETGEQRKWLEKEAARTGVDHGVLVSAIVKTEDEFQEVKDTAFGREVLETGETHV